MKRLPWKTAFYSEVTKVKIASLFNQFDSNVIPSASNFRSVVLKVSRHAALSKPYYYVVSIQKGMQRSHCEKMFSSIDETTFIYLLESMRPQRNVIAKKFYPWYHNNPFIKAKEEIVMDFLVDYVKSMDSKNALLFMKYITGLDLFILSIHVDFNGADNVDQMVLTANICTQTLHLSKYISTQNQFNGLMEVV